MENANIELHAHPFLSNKITLPEVVMAMDKKGIDVLVAVGHCLSIYQHLKSETKKYYPNSVIDNAGVILPDGKVIIAGEEYKGPQLHLLSIGYCIGDVRLDADRRQIMDECLKHGALMSIDHAFTDNGKTLTAGHISEEEEQKLETLCKDYSGKVTIEKNGYCISWMRGVLRVVLNLAGVPTKYHDVNKKAEQFAAKLDKLGYNVPLIGGTDLHVRRISHFDYMGNARLIATVEGNSASEVVESLKKAIFDRNYKLRFKEVPSVHLLETFCVPKLIEGNETDPPDKG